MPARKRYSRNMGLNDNKQSRVKRLLLSFRYAARGMKKTAENEANMQYHLAAAAVVIVLALLVPFPLWKWVVLLLTIGMVLSLELLNTALENTVDLVTEQYHPLAEKAKDAAAAGVFIFTITAIIIGILLFAEPVSVWL